MQTIRTTTAVAAIGLFGAMGFAMSTARRRIKPSLRLRCTASTSRGTAWSTSASEEATAS